MSAIGVMSDHNLVPPAANFTNARGDRPGNERPKKRLSFAAMATVQLIDCAATREERSRCHYGRDELSAFSAEAKALASSARGAGSPGSDCVVRLDADPALRGMELRLFRDRSKSVAFGRKALLRYQRSLSGSAKTGEERLRYLAAVSARMSRWSRQVAAETARLDSVRAYYGDYLIPISDPVVIEPHPCVVKRRRVTCDEGDSRRANAVANEVNQSMSIETSRAPFAKRRRVSFD